MRYESPLTRRQVMPSPEHNQLKELTVEESEEVDAYDEKINTKQNILTTKLEN